MNFFNVNVMYAEKTVSSGWKRKEKLAKLIRKQLEKKL